LDAQTKSLSQARQTLDLFDLIGRCSKEIGHIGEGTSEEEEGEHVGEDEKLRCGEIKE